MLSIKSTDVSVLGAFSIFFVLWWGVGAGVCTFKSPFAPDGTSAVAAGNGYFSVWTGFLASLLLLSKTMSIGDAKSLKGRAAGLFFAAVMLLIATIKYVDPNDIAIFGMASAAATILITILIIFADMKESAIQTLIPILVLLWAATAGVLTFRSGSPFTGMNNGYFSSWFGFFMAAQMTGSVSGPLNSNIFQILALGVVVVLSAYFYNNNQPTDVTQPVTTTPGVEMVFQDNIVPDNQAYMIAVGAVAGFLALFHYWCSVFKPALLETVLFNVGDSPVSMRRAMAIFLVPWVAAGAIVGTFGVTGGGVCRRERPRRRQRRRPLLVDVCLPLRVGDRPWLAPAGPGECHSGGAQRRRPRHVRRVRVLARAGVHLGLRRTLPPRAQGAAPPRQQDRHPAPCPRLARRGWRPDLPRLGWLLSRRQRLLRGLRRPLPLLRPRGQGAPQPGARRPARRRRGDLGGVRAPP